MRNLLYIKALWSVNDDMSEQLHAVPVCDKYEVKHRMIW